MKHIILAASIVTAVAATAAHADIALTPSNDGWIAANGTPDHFGFQNTSNYLAGNCTGGGCTGGEGEYRNYFSFDIPAYIGTITSATLSIYNGDVFTVQHSPFIYELTSTSSVSFSALGEGTEYAFGFYEESQSGGTSAYTLNATAIADITPGGSFTASGRVIDADFSPGASAEAAFSSTGGSGQVSLVLGGVSPAPEPASWALMLVGFGGLGAVVRRSRRQRAIA